MTLRKLATVACITVTLIGGVFSSGASAQTKLKPPAQSIPATFFGLHVHYAYVSDRHWPDVPFGAWRLNTEHVAWYDLEPKKGQWNFSALDKDVDLAQAHHVQLMFALGYTPTWASARPQSRDDKHPGYTAEPKDMNDWRDFLRTLATRYKGKIQAYELWNEPNSPEFYSGTVDQLVRLAKEGYTTLHQVDPTITVVSPPPAGGNLPYLDKYLAAGGGEYADIIAYHFYVTPDPPEAMVDMAEKIKQIMAKYGVANKPLWCTETGYYMQAQYRDVKPVGTVFPVLPYDQAAAYVARAYILTWAAGVQRVYWWAWDDPNLGLADGQGFDIGMTRKPAAEAYDRVAHWLIGALMTSCSSDDSGTWVCEITRPDDYGGHIVWNVRGDKNFTIPEAWHARWRTNLSGPNSSVAGAKEVEIGIKPILLENKTEKAP
jgi:Glycosyl hydrolases family 39